MSIGVTNAIIESGMYVEPQVQGIPAKFLVDIGSMITLVSLRITERNPQNMRPGLIDDWW